VYEDLFLPSHLCLTPPSWGTPCDINAVYTSLNSTFSGLQFRRWQYGSIFIRLAVIASETREMSRNAKKIWPYSSSKSSKVIELGVNGKPICDFLLVINCNFSRICYRFRYSRLNIENCWFYKPLPCLTPRSGRTPYNFWTKLTQQKLEGWFTISWKFHNPNFNRFCMINPSDRQTDRQMERL